MRYSSTYGLLCGRYLMNTLLDLEYFRHACRLTNIYNYIMIVVDYCHVFTVFNIMNKMNVLDQNRYVVQIYNGKYVT